MQRQIKIIATLVSVLIISGCNSAKTCKVIIYSSETMTFNKQYEAFNDACRTVMYDLSEDENDNDTMPFCKELAEGKSVNGRTVYSRVSFKTRDVKGNDYSITSTTVGKDEPVVILETTNPDKGAFVNALCEEFYRKGFEVKMYD